MKEEMLEGAPLLGEAGVDAIELSGGSPLFSEVDGDPPGPHLERSG